MAQVVGITIGTSPDKRLDPADAHRAVEEACLEEQQSDFVAWLREYHRWTESGCSAQKNRGDIEWGLEGSDGSLDRAAPPPSASDATVRTDDAAP